MGGGVEASAGEDRATPQQAAQEALCLEHGHTLVCFSPFAQVFGKVAQPWPDERNTALAAEAPRHVFPYILSRPRNSPDLCFADHAALLRQASTPLSAVAFGELRKGAQPTLRKAAAGGGRPSSLP